MVNIIFFFWPCLVSLSFHSCDTENSDVTHTETPKSASYFLALTTSSYILHHCFSLEKVDVDGVKWHGKSQISHTQWLKALSCYSWCDQAGLLVVKSNVSVRSSRILNVSNRVFASQRDIFDTVSFLISSFSVSVIHHPADMVVLQTPNSVCPVLSFLPLQNIRDSSAE